MGIIRKEYFLGIVAVFGFLAIVTSCLSCKTSEYKQIETTLPVLTGKVDGTYRGEQDFSGTPINVVLEVVLKNQQITSIKILKHTGSPIGKRAEKLTERIIAEQSLDLDVVSGATVSSKAILKAVENALE